jgi:hypothetical protein
LRDLTRLCNFFWSWSAASGRDFHLTDVHGKVVKEILA